MQEPRFKLLSLCQQSRRCMCAVGAQYEIEPLQQQFHVQCNNQTHTVGPHTRYMKHTTVAKAVAQFLSRFLTFFVLVRNGSHAYHMHITGKAVCFPFSTCETLPEYQVKYEVNPIPKGNLVYRNIIILSYYHIIILSYYHIIILSYYHIIILSYYRIIILECGRSY